jgi:hypothetical protein
MFLPSRFFHRISSASGLLLIAVPLVVATIAASRPAAAQTTRLWTQSQFEEFEKGTPQGVAITSDGHLSEAPGLTDLLTTPSTFVWSVAVDKSGVAYLGTGSPAAVLRLGREPGAKPFALFETRDISVQVVRLGPDGTLYAATLPSGKVYKLKTDSTTRQDDATATVVFDASTLGSASANGKAVSAKPSTKSHYIWDMTFDSAGRLYIATGDPGAVYRVDPSKPGAKPEEFFKSDEAHIRSLAWDAKGDLIAGSDGSGLVYRINPQGKGYVLFDSPKHEVTSVVVGADGTIYAACVGDKGRNQLPPLPVQGAGAVTITVVQPGSLQAANASTSIPEGTEIYALSDGQAPRKLWSGKEEIVYAMASRPDGLLALTGNRGRVLRIQEDGSFADVAHLQAQQGLNMAVAPGSQGILIGTGNTGKLYRFGMATAKHEYASDVLDTGSLSRFGRVEIGPASSAYEIWTRTGNVEQPLRGWSDWQPLQDGAVASPPGRFLQWKAELQPGGVLGGVGVNYLPVNAAPVVDAIVVVPGARIPPQMQSSGSQTVNISFDSSGQSVSADDSSSSPLTAAKDRTAVAVRWAAHDDNGDNLIYSLYLRGDGESVWRLLKDKIKDKAYSFDATMVPDGGYQIKVVASDALSHTPGDALTGSKVSTRFVVDTTPPVITGLKATLEAASCAHAPCPQQVRLTFDAQDTVSPISRAEYSLNLGTWQFIAPVGGLSDSKTEHYSVLVPATGISSQPGEQLITIRVYDRYDNVGLAKTIFTTTAK